jgi:hypothetical protein
MDYVGAPSFFAIRKVDNSRGATVPGTGIAVGNFVYFLSEEGFLVFNGARTMPIGHEKIDRFVRYAVRWEDAESRCSVTHYPDKHSIIWSLPFIFFGRNFLLGYNYELEKWYFISLFNEGVFILPSRSAAYSMDEPPYDDYIMDNTTPPNLGDVNMDTLGIGVTSRRELAIINSNHGVSTFTSASNMTGTVATGDYEMPEGRRTLIRGVRPAYAGTGSVGVQIGSRFAAGANMSFTGSSQVKSTGVAPTRAGGRYHRAYFQLAGNISQLAGFDYVIGRMGKR